MSFFGGLRWGGLVLCLSVQAIAATFGTVVAPAGGASYSDIALDEARGRLYLVNSTASRIEIYNTRTRAFQTSIPSNTQPVTEAMSPDGKTLYVVCYTDATLDFYDLTANTPTRTRSVQLPSSPEGIAVGGDGRIVITTVAAGTTNTMWIYDPVAGTLQGVPVTPPPPTPPVLPTPSGRQFVSYRSRMITTVDGRFIIGANGTSTTAKVVFVYEVASGTVLRSRSVTNLSSTLSVSPDGSKFMAGATLFDTKTLQVLAQENVANSPFPYTAGTNFNLQANQGGSIFSPDGKSLYAAFNVAPIGAARPNITQLLVNDPDNLLINMGIQTPENLAGKMVIDVAGTNVYAISDSGFTILPVGTIAQSPIVAADTRAVVMTSDPCGVFQKTATLTLTNGGRGGYTVTATPYTATTTTGFAPGGGGGPGGIIIGPGGIVIPIPGGGGGAGGATGATGGTTASTATFPTVQVVNTATGANLNFRYTSSATATSPGTIGPSDFLLTSAQAINIPPVIHAYQNYRDSVSTGTINPLTINATATEGLTDVLFDSARQKVYISNSGMNRLEVFDTQQKKFIASIKVGQLPHGMAFGQDGLTLYVSNTGGESISIVDVIRGVETGKVVFPALPFNAGVAIITPNTIAATGRGPQFMMSDGSMWKVLGNQAIPRALNPTIFGANARTVGGGNPSFWSLSSTPGGEFMLLMTGTGNAYLYDYTVDDFTLTKQVLTTPINGYLGTITAGPQGRYYTVGGVILNASLTPQNGQATGTAATRITAASAAISPTQVAQFTVPVRANGTAAVPDAGRIEIYDANTSALQRVAFSLEGPATALGTGANARATTFPRTMAIDAANMTAYVLTTSGLSIVNLAPTPPAGGTTPTIRANGVVSAANLQPVIAPGGLVSIFGTNLGDSQTASAPLPTVLGNSCVTLNNVPIPLTMTSTGQITGQIPTTLAAGRYPLVVRALTAQTMSAPATVTVAKYAPAVMIDSSGQAAVVHSDGSFVNEDNPANRDETLKIFATGMGPTHGGAVTTGQASPQTPLALTDSVQVYIGNPSWKQAQMIVKSSYLVPGMIGVDQITIVVPGFHIKGSALPLMLKVGGVTSATKGTGVPYVSVN